MASWFQFLRIEADLAETFIESARIHIDAANAARSLRNAHRALAEIHRGLANPRTRYLSRSEVASLERRCREIESALALLSPPPPPETPMPRSDS
jgi:cob(I)alamin adenosyltransferase